MKTADELVEMALPSVLEGLKSEIKGTIEWQVKDQAAKLVAEHVTAYIKDSVLPELTIQLIESRDGLMQIAAQLAPRVTSALVEALMGELKAKLERSWDRAKIFEAMFKS